MCVFAMEVKILKNVLFSLVARISGCSSEYKIGLRHFYDPKFIAGAHVFQIGEKITSKEKVWRSQVLSKIQEVWRHTQIHQ